MDIDPQDVQMKNGVNGEERSPTPPPHKSTGTSDEAESFKLAGNKFFKDGNYKRAIEEYNKGMLLLLLLLLPLPLDTTKWLRTKPWVLAMIYGTLLTLLLFYSPWD